MQQRLSGQDSLLIKARGQPMAVQQQVLSLMCPDWHQVIRQLISGPRPAWCYPCTALMSGETAAGDLLV